MRIDVLARIFPFLQGLNVFNLFDIPNIQPYKTPMEMLLTDIKENEKAKIIDFTSGKSMRCRLFSMGITPGKEIRVIKSTYNSPIILKNMDSTISIGHGMASKILVERLLN